jgi:hypothetical protein
MIQLDFQDLLQQAGLVLHYARTPILSAKGRFGEFNEHTNSDGSKANRFIAAS